MSNKPKGKLSAEEERIRRIRESQIAARDPKHKLQKSDPIRRHAKGFDPRKEARVKLIFGMSYSSFGLLMGALVGVGVVMGIRMALPDQWQILAVPAVLICMVVGFMVLKQADHTT
jgi:hypothetical protein